jgi:bifunctional non-homologous end joining protein LigD
MKDPLAGLPEQARERTVAAEQPSWTDPMLATLTDRRFSDPGWEFEPKLDGERRLAFEGGRSSFARLQRRMQLGDAEATRRTGVAVYLYLFDVLHLNGCDVTRLGLRQRKAVLRRLLTFRGPLRFTPHRNADGEAYWREACRKGWEG